MERSAAETHGNDVDHQTTSVAWGSALTGVAPMVGAAPRQFVTTGHGMASGDSTTVPDASMGRRRGTGDLKAEVVSIERIPFDSPGFKERTQWAFL